MPATIMPDPHICIIMFVSPAASGRVRRSAQAAARGHPEGFRALRND